MNSSCGRVAHGKRALRSGRIKPPVSSALKLPVESQKMNPIQATGGRNGTTRISYKYTKLTAEG
jgi:hypothetical protein